MFRTTTPETMSANPIRAGISSFCPRKSQPIIAISTIPTPDHIAYAIPTGMVRKLRDKKKNVAPYPAITTNDGHNWVNPLLDFNAEVATTSLRIAIERKSH
jgi:hypothetical protein